MSIFCDYDDEPLRVNSFYNIGEDDYYFPLDLRENYIQETQSNTITNEFPNSGQNSPSIEQNQSKDQKLLGRKNKGRYKGIHDKLSYDNMFRTIRINVIKELIDFINKLIFKTYNGKIGQGRFIMKLFNFEQSKNKNVKENKDFINKSLKEIFSVDITKKYNNYNKSHNKDLITKLLNEEDYEKKYIFENIFKIKFIDCLDHLCGKNNFKELEGIRPFDEIFQEEKDIFENLKDLINNLEERISQKHSRNRGKKKLND